MKLNQNEAQEIIRNAYGANAYAIGSAWDALNNERSIKE